PGSPGTRHQDGDSEYGTENSEDAHHPFCIPNEKSRALFMTIRIFRTWPSSADRSDRPRQVTTWREESCSRGSESLSWNLAMGEPLGSSNSTRSSPLDASALRTRRFPRQRNAFVTSSAGAEPASSDTKPSRRHVARPPYPRRLRSHDCSSRGTSARDTAWVWRLTSRRASGWASSSAA